MSRRACDIMSKPKVVVRPITPVREAEALALHFRVHHLPVIDADGDLVGMVCLCDIRDAPASGLVADCVSSPVVTATIATTLSDAAGMMREHGVGCLPIVSSGGHLIGVVTRRDLREVGIFSRERGVDSCQACGSTHSLEPAEKPGDLVFCADCVAHGTEFANADTSPGA
jgi:CBS domain-containing protein